VERILLAALDPIFLGGFLSISLMGFFLWQTTRILYETPIPGEPRFMDPWMALGLWCIPVFGILWLPVWMRKLTVRSRQLHLWVTGTARDAPQVTRV
jgi:hypothetical protein